MKKKTKRSAYNKKRKTNLWIIIVFILLAIITIFGLEYIRHNKGQNSFIFGNVKKKVKGKTKTEKRSVVTFDDRVQVLLQKKQIKYNHFIDPLWNYHHYKFELPKQSFVNIVRALKSISQKYGMKFNEIEKAVIERVYLYSISNENRITHKFLISIISDKKKKIKKKVINVKDKTPKIAFIIDDIGYHDTDANDLKKIGIPITGSIIPSTPYAREEGSKLYAFGLEMMIHLPMQAKDTNLKYPKSEFVVMSSTINDIIKLIDDAKKKIPYARGLNNHMGSLITSNRAMITKVLTIVKKRKLFFIDSRTTATTVAGEIAKEMGVKTASKDIFIDHIQTYEESIKRINILIRIALHNGKGIAIGHPHQTTFQAIKDSVKKIRDKGIDIVFVSSLLE